jgi:hypothetical protein
MAISVLGSPLFLASDLMASGIDVAPVFWLAATLCEHGSVAMEQPVISSVDSPWQAAVANMDALPTRPAIDYERLTPSVCMLDNQSGIFWLVSPMGQVYRPNWVLLDSGAQPLMLGKTTCIDLGIRRSKLESCSFHIQTSVGGTSDRSHFMTHERLSM